MANPDDVQTFILHRPDDLPPEPDFANDIYASLGRFIVAWGSMESHLDALARMSINIGNSQSTPHMKVNLGQKLDQMKQVFRDTPELNHLHPHIQEMSRLLKENGHLRDALVHSILLGFDTKPPGKFIVRHVRHPRGTEIEVTRVEYAAEDISSFIKAAKAAHHLIISLLEEVSQLQDPERLRIAREQDLDPANPRTPLHL